MEDLAGMSAAGLYESVVGVTASDPEAVRTAVAEVWASLFTRRAVLSRRCGGSRRGWRVWWDIADGSMNVWTSVTFTPMSPSRLERPPSYPPTSQVCGGPSESRHHGRTDPGAALPQGPDSTSCFLPGLKGLIACFAVYHDRALYSSTHYPPYPHNCSLSQVSFVLHTARPSDANANVVLVEAAPGQGETLAAATSGTPWRFEVDKTTGGVDTLAFANFSRALLVAGSQGEREGGGDADCLPALGARGADNQSLIKKQYSCWVGLFKGSRCR